MISNKVEPFEHDYFYECSLCDKKMRKGIWIEQAGCFHYDCAKYMMKKFDIIFKEIKKEKLIKKITGI